jgi:hypothetical protein
MSTTSESKHSNRMLCVLVINCSELYTYTGHKHNAFFGSNTVRLLFLTLLCVPSVRALKVSELYIHAECGGCCGCYAKLNCVAMSCYHESSTTAKTSTADEHVAETSVVLFAMI